MATDPDARAASPTAGREVAVLGVVSFLTDVSSEAIFAVLPLFLTSVLGVGALVLGVIEGLADFAASSLDLASGFVSDRLGRRKSIAVVGYGLSSLAKALLVLARGAGLVGGFRVVERLGKSIRGAPRDALLGAIAPPSKRGLSFGIQKAFDKAGAIVGPLAAYGFLAHYGQTRRDFQGLFAMAVVPAIASVAVLALFVRERAVPSRNDLSLRTALRELGPRYRHYLASATLFSLCYFSFAFMLVAASRVGFSVSEVVLLYALCNASSTVASVPLGWLGDRVGRARLIAGSYVLYAGIAAGFALVSSRLAVAGLFVVYGIFYAIDEGQTKAYITDLVAPEVRATAVGVYGFTTGVAYLVASLGAGVLWAAVGPTAAFVVSAGVAVLALSWLWLGGPGLSAPLDYADPARVRAVL